ncbi:7tm 6 domain containing protein, partial [Asbolus verrucosus]
LHQKTTMERFNWKETLRLNIFMLKIVGLWPGDDKSYGCNLYTLYAIISIFLFQIVHIFFQSANILFVLDDLEALTNNISVVLMEMSIALKTYCLVKNMKMLKELMITIDSDSFQPKTPEQKNLIQPNLNTWKTVVSSFWIFAVSCMVLWVLFPILDKSVKEYRLPFLAWYPYDTKTSPLYELTYFYQALSLSFIAMANLNTDTLIAALNMYIGAQFDILCDDLRNLRINNETSTEVDKKLKSCVKHHREILKFVDYANQFYNWLLLVKFFVGGVSLGITMFQMTIVVPFSSEFYSIAGYAQAVSLEVFMYCWFGNEIEVKSSKIPYAVFESDWTSLSPKVQKNMIIFVLRVQRSLRISALGLFNLSLETFVKILRTAWSYFALLRQVNAPT